MEMDLPPPVLALEDRESLSKSGGPSSPSSMLKQALLENAAKAEASSISHRSDEEKASDGHACNLCNFTARSQALLQAHIASQHSSQNQIQQPKSVQCPLCQEQFKELNKIESHLVETHNVTSEGMQRLLALVDTSVWVTTTTTQKRSKSPTTRHAAVSAGTEDSDSLDTDCHASDCESKDKAASDDPLCADDLTCSACGKNFGVLDELFHHQSESGHLELKQTPRGPGYLCWKKACNQYFMTPQAVQVHFKEIHSRRTHQQHHQHQLAVSERHVYKYRCNQCSLAFKTVEKLHLHSQYHVIRAATQCVLCGRSFRSVAALQKHVETSHIDMSPDELEQYKASLVNNPLLTSGGGAVLDPQTTELLKKESNREEDGAFDDIMDTDDGIHLNDNDSGVEAMDTGLAALAEGTTFKEQFFEDYINSQAIAEDTYNDPARKYKCHFSGLGGGPRGPLPAGSHASARRRGPYGGGRQLRLQTLLL